MLQSLRWALVAVALCGCVDEDGDGVRDRRFENCAADPTEGCCRRIAEDQLEGLCDEADTGSFIEVLMAVPEDSGECLNAYCEVWMSQGCNYYSPSIGC